MHHNYYKTLLCNHSHNNYYLFLIHILSLVFSSLILLIIWTFIISLHTNYIPTFITLVILSINRIHIHMKCHLKLIATTITYYFFIFICKVISKYKVSSSALNFSILWIYISAFHTIFFFIFLIHVQVLLYILHYLTVNKNSLLS